ncbi:lipocalin-like domain-containing protein [Aquimarina algiphila]|uniref:lipocalin family protein n=1 Tax=Aquimarina algiphila TaxID=2047982 RepID=UPI00232AEEE2|nr:lipocalin family protein [Aquimarina algiphila]
MKKGLTYTLMLTILWIFASCTTTNPKENIQHINGYWEIKKVQLKDGSEKEYNFNQSIDFFEVNDSVGIRKKVQPKLDGGFIITKDSETFSLAIKNDSLRIHYKTSLATWTETIISVKENQMVIQNETGNVYFYNRYQKIKL